MADVLVVVVLNDDDVAGGAEFLMVFCTSHFMRELASRSHSAEVEQLASNALAAAATTDGGEIDTDLDFS
jgi:hypothetical protein